jgi:hypothetical protein
MNPETAVLSVKADEAKDESQRMKSSPKAKGLFED